MRLSEWRKTAPSKESMTNKVLAELKPVLVDLGAEDDPECWVAWGDDPEMRYSVLAPTISGVIYVAVRMAGPDTGPRATGKLIRWSKVSVSELGIEATGGHRIVAVQVEGLVLKGTDDQADRICEFVRGLIGAIDNRSQVTMSIPFPRRARISGAVVASLGAGAKAHRALPTRPKAAARAVAKVAPRAANAAKAAAAPTRPPVVAKPKPSGAAVPKAVPAGKPASGSAARPARKAAASTGLALTTVPGSKARASTVPTPPKPIAERAAAVQHGGKPGTGPRRPGPEGPEPEADRSDWVSPHPIEESPGHEPNRPRPWTP